MENIKYMTEITQYINREQTIVGNCVYFGLANGNNICVYCNANAVEAQVINKTLGNVDRVELPFENYFSKTCTTPGAPQWTPHIDGGRWYFSESYSHVIPKPSDFNNAVSKKSPTSISGGMNCDKHGVFLTFAFHNSII